MRNGLVFAREVDHVHRLGQTLPFEPWPLRAPVFRACHVHHSKLRRLLAGCQGKVATPRRACHDVLGVGATKRDLSSMFAKRLRNEIGGATDHRRGRALAASVFCTAPCPSLASRTGPRQMSAPTAQAIAARLFAINVLLGPTAKSQTQAPNPWKGHASRVRHIIGVTLQRSTLHAQ